MKDKMIRPVNVEDGTWYETILPDEEPQTFPTYLMAAEYVSEMLELDGDE